MKFALATIAATVLATAVNAQFMINTPSNVVECEPTLLQWSGGVPPYFLAIVDGNSPSTTLENLGQVNGSSLSFIVNFASGTSLGLNLKDSTGTVAQSGAFPVQAGTSTACVGQGVSTSVPAGGSTTTSASTTSAGGTSTSTTVSTSVSTSHTTATSTTGGSSTGSSSHASGTTTSPSSATTTPASSAAGPAARFAKLGVVGIVGVVVAVLLA